MRSCTINATSSKYAQNLINYVRFDSGYGRNERLALLEYLSKKGSSTIEKIMSDVNGKEVIKAVNLGIAFGILDVEETETSRGIFGQKRGVYDKLKLTLSDKIKFSTLYGLYVNDMGVPPEEIAFMKDSYEERFNRLTKPV